MKDDVAIRVQGIGKKFRVPHEKHNSLKSKAVNIFGPRKYTEFQALDDISFEVKKGEFFGIVGKNGSGKSTLLKILANIYQPSVGKVKINGSLAPFIELGVGFNMELTGRENVFLSGTILGLTRKKIEAIYDDIVAFAEIEEFMDQKLKNYSSGMQVRLAFSIAVRAESDILLIDEVLAVGDAAFQAKCYKYFNQLKNSGKTIVFISHDMASIKKFCDKVLYIRESKVVALGDTEEVADMYSIDNYTRVERGGKKSNSKEGPLYIDDYRLKSDVVKQGSPIQVEVGLVADSAHNAYVALSFTREEDGLYVFGYNSRLTMSKISKGKSRVACIIQPDQLGPGKYNVRVAVFDDASGGLIDSSSLDRFVIVLSEPVDRDGVLNINAKWEELK